MNGTDAVMDRSVMDRSEVDRRLRWLVLAVWRQMADSNCIEASLTLHGALKELGIESVVQAVAVWTEDLPNKTNAFLGRAAYEHIRNWAAAEGHVMAEYPHDSVAHAGFPDFFVDGGHVVVLLPEFDLLLDATLDQIPGFGIKHLIGSTVGMTHTEPAMFGKDDCTVAYFLVDDVVDMDPDHRDRIIRSGEDLGRMGHQVDFTDSVFEMNIPLFQRCVS